ncbi:tyrosine-protein kinase domain-containing protein [Devosia sp. SD17-2]|uniref:GumC family protein n=1 Tax=Devosia sp. SD17-2 TaxID=2976459 RepID=UPI0023D8A830|nr:tyrosine-protein kinase domain-containing protein [Devosia sp. SD17-2]WEJ32281.1 Wzz/FepE/Etk N-terminal domain-containing protein [Devosia sp. SD17-2]
MDDHEVDLRAFLAVLVRQARLIALVVGVCLIVGIWVALLSPTQYSATALVRVDPRQDDLLDPQTARPLSLATENARIDSEVEIMRSAPTFLRIIDNAAIDIGTIFPDRPGIAEHARAFIGMGEPSAPALGPLHLLGRLEDAVTFDRRGSTYIIAATATTDSPDGAALLANAVVSAHIDLQREAKMAAIADAIETLSPQLAIVSAALALRREAVDAFVDENIRLFAMPLASGQLSAEVEAHLASVSAARDLRGRITHAQTALDEGDLAAVSQALASQPIDDMVIEREGMLARSAQLPLVGPEISAIETDLVNLEGRLLAAVHAELDLLKAQLLPLDAEIASRRDVVLDGLDDGSLPPAVEERLHILQRGNELARTQHDQLLARLDDLQLRSELQQADSRLVVAATPPQQPSSRGLPFILSVSAFLGVGLGVGAALFRESYMSGVVTLEQLALLTGREVTTAIPAITPSWQRDSGTSSSMADAVVRTPLSSFSESLRRLRLGLDLRLPSPYSGSGGGRGRVILVTSAVVDEGKTTTALALARTYALSGRRVLIIDADLRRPSLFIHLDAAPAAGLVEYLTGKLPPERFPTAIKTDPLSAISAVVNTRPGAGPTEHLLVGELFRNLVVAARDTFDYIILDTPPLTEVVDAAYAMQFADAVVMLTRYAATRQRDVLRAMRVLENTRPDLPPVLLALTQHPEKPFVANDRYVSHYVVVQ